MYLRMLLLIAFNQQFAKYFSSMEISVSTELCCCPFLSLLIWFWQVSMEHTLAFWFHRFWIYKSSWSSSWEIPLSWKREARKSLSFIYRKLSWQPREMHSLGGQNPSWDILTLNYKSQFSSVGGFFFFFF